MLSSIFYLDFSIYELFQKKLIYLLMNKWQKHNLSEIIIFLLYYFLENMKLYNILCIFTTA